MNPNFLLMALAGLSRDPNAGMNALRGYQAQSDLMTKENERQASGQAAAAALEGLKQAQLNRQAESGFKDRASSISKMPETVMAGPNTAIPDSFNPADPSSLFPANSEELDAPIANEERQRQEAQLVNEFQQYKTAKIHPADALVSVLKTNQNVPADSAAKYVSLIYGLDERENNAIKEMGKMLMQHQLNVQAETQKQGLIGERQKEFEQFKSGLPQTNQTKFSDLPETYKQIAIDKGFNLQLPESQQQFRDYIQTPEGQKALKEKKPDKETASQADERWRQIDVALSMDPASVSSESKAWHKSYEKQARIRPLAFGESRLNIMLQTPEKAIDNETGKGVFVTKGEAVANRNRYSPVSTDLDFQAVKKAVQTANSPTIKRMVSAGEALFEGTKDKDGKQLIEPTMDKLVRLRNEIPDGFFGSISNQVMKFNSWDQFINWQVSDPKVAEFKSTLLATVERMGLIYQGGVGATSDQKIKLAQTLLEGGLSKQAFAIVVNSHKEDLMNTVNSYASVDPNKAGAGPRHRGRGSTVPTAKPTHQYVPGKGLVPIGGK